MQMLTFWEHPSTECLCKIREHSKGCISAGKKQPWSVAKILPRQQVLNPQTKFSLAQCKHWADFSSFFSSQLCCGLVFTHLVYSGTVLHCHQSSSTVLSCFHIFHIYYWRKLRDFASVSASFQSQIKHCRGSLTTDLSLPQIHQIPFKGFPVSAF